MMPIGHLTTFIDLEASSLGPASYPIEVGWATLEIVGSAAGPGGWADGLAVITTESHLIRTPHEWDPDGYGWSHESAKVHGIAQNELMLRGKAPAEVAKRLNQVHAGALLISDSPEFDRRWLMRLFSVALQPAFNLSHEPADAHILAMADALGLAPDDHAWVETQLRTQARITHRAADDARYWATRGALVLERAASLGR